MATMRAARRRPGTSASFNRRLINAIGVVSFSDTTPRTTHRGVGPTEDILAYSTGLMGRRY